MPTENERKYILTLDCEEEITSYAKKRHDIKQAYLAAKNGMTLRIRDFATSSKTKTQERYQICLKQQTAERVIEIEKKINKRDFDDLWNHSVSKLEKTRYDILFKIGTQKYLWEVDFFKRFSDDGEVSTYFAMAEHEMPEGQIDPDVIPDLIKKHLIYEVPLSDDRFGSKKIADVDYAMSLYTLLEGVNI